MKLETNASLILSLVKKGKPIAPHIPDEPTHALGLFREVIRLCYGEYRTAETFYYLRDGDKFLLSPCSRDTVIDLPMERITVWLYEELPPLARWRILRSFSEKIGKTILEKEHHGISLLEGQPLKMKITRPIQVKCRPELTKNRIGNRT